MRLTMDSFGCLGARCFKQAVDLAFLLTESVLEGLRFMVVLGF